MKVTIVSICYNQENFIAQALDSFLMQKTDFDFNIIIADDASTDKTVNIITEYALNHPDIIKPVLRNKNIGVIDNFIDALSRVKSEYVIYNEGDDYFTDPLKLQKQVNFLDSNTDYSICFHPVIVKYQDKSKTDEFFPPSELINNKRTLSLHDLLNVNFIQTNSCLYRWRFGDEKKIEALFPRNILPCDYFLHLLHAEVGKIGFLPEAMAVYRKWSGGIWAGAGITDEWFIKCGVNHLHFYQEVEKHFNVDRSINIKILTNKILGAYLRKHCWDKLQQFYQEFPDLYDENFEASKDKTYNLNARRYFRYLLLSKITFGRLKIKYAEKAEKMLKDCLV